jgi:2-keto-myo-inositol isomerase
MRDAVNRRSLLTGAAGGLAGFAIGVELPAQAAPKKSGFRFCFNTSTIRGQKLPLDKEIEIVAKAGYDGIEPWIGEIDEFAKSGGSLKDLAKRLSDLGLTVEDGIGFAEWIVDDDARRSRGLEEARRSMDLISQLGGKRLAAPPSGATDRADMDLARVAERYRALLELGEKMGVVPQLEVWGFSKTLTRLGPAAMVALESGHPNACILADAYHLYKGGSAFSGVRLLSSSAMHVFHINDYPADPPRERVTDAHRVFPGDGVAPLEQLFRDLQAIGYNGALSLEVFNRDYWKMDPAVVAKTGLQKMKAVAARAIEK